MRSDAGGSVFHGRGTAEAIVHADLTVRELAR
jgi:hypothetical protein